MKLTCKQCGKEFELSESEINFYKSKNLHIPKRCGQCRQANKKKKAAATKSSENTHIQNRNDMPSGNSGWNNWRNNKFLCAILIIAIVSLTGGIVLSHADLFSKYSESTNPIYSDDAYASEDIHNQPETATETFNSQPETQSDTLSSQSETESDTLSSQSETESDTLSSQPETESDTLSSQSETGADTANNGSETGKSETDTAQSEETVPEASETDAQTAQSSGVSTPQYKFRNSDLLNDHFEKHGKEMGFATAEDYQAAASAVVASANALHKLEAEDGDDVYYIESSNDFVIVSTDGYIRTYFRPNSGIEYYNRQ